MLEALISLRIGREDTAVKGRGDVLAIKSRPCVWSHGEKRTCVVVDLDEAQFPNLADRVAEAGGVLAYPFATDADAKQTQMTLRSRRFLDVSLLTDAQRARLLDAQQTGKHLTWAQVQAFIGTRTA